MPLYNWIKCTNGEMQYTRKKIKRGSALLDEEAWEKLHDHYITEYGLSKVYKRMLEQMKKVAMMQLDYVLTGDNFTLTKLEMEEQKLTAMMQNAGTGISLEQGLVYLSKWLGYPVKTKEMSVKAYFDTLKEYERYNKISNGQKDK